jgi:hypothetical protein
VDVEVGEVAEVVEVVEVVEGELVGWLVAATVAEEGAAVELKVGETGAAVGLGGIGWGLVAEGTLEAGAAAGLAAVGGPVLGRTLGVVHAPHGAHGVNDPLGGCKEGGRPPCGGKIRVLTLKGVENAGSEVRQPRYRRARFWRWLVDAGYGFSCRGGWTGPAGTAILRGADRADAGAT